MAFARTRALAKLNLTLEVLNRRQDGFHDVRTIFQTISLADTLEVEAQRGRATRIAQVCDVEIPGENLVTRAANIALDALGINARVSCRLRKRIPMGAGLGGGSSNAAAMLRVLPALLGKSLPPERLIELGSELGSDVPFFLIGGTVLGLGRGTELYPLPDLPRLPVMLVAPTVHISTAEAYRSLDRGTAEPERENATAGVTQSMASNSDWLPLLVNDFEAAAFARHPGLARIRQRLERAGARAARMTGSGSALFGVFDSKQTRDQAAAVFPGERIYRVSFVRRMLA
jgi:4-diphosphocytidyl-2-C-methyl-D-erythritol kinase